MSRQYSPSRHWTRRPSMFRFTIRGLLLLTLVAGLGVGLWTQREVARTERLKNEALREQGESLRFAIEREGFKIADSRAGYGPVLLRGLNGQAAEWEEHDNAREARSDKELDKLVEAVSGAKNPPRAAEAYRALFKQFGSRDLARLLSHSSDRIALQAAWEQVERTVPEAESRYATRPDAAQLGRFVGFLEGRSHLRLPAWWSQAVLDSRANR